VLTIDNETAGTRVAHKTVSLLHDDVPSVRFYNQAACRRETI